ncbi:MAG TPA: hypothetical protein VGD67_14380 [Pseudonocardiaceae bacterium]
MRRSLLAAAVLTAVLPIAACGGDNTTSTSNSTSGSAATTSGGVPAPSDDKVAWVDKACTEIVTMTDAQTASPPDLQGADPATALKEFDEYIGTNIGIVEDTIAGLKDLGPSPFEGGDEAVAALVSGLETLKTTYESTRTTVASANTADPQALQAAMLQALSGLAAGGEEFGTALEGIANNTEVSVAANQAPSCQKLTGGAPAPTTTT